MLHIIVFDYNVDIMAVNKSKLIVAIKSAEGDFVDSLLNGWNPGHRGVATSHAIGFHRLLACRVVKIHHARHRSLNEARPFSRMKVEHVGLPHAEVAYHLTITPHCVVVASRSDFNKVAHPTL